MDSPLLFIILLCFLKTLFDQNNSWISNTAAKSNCPIFFVFNQRYDKFVDTDQCKSNLALIRNSSRRSPLIEKLDIVVETNFSPSIESYNDSVGRVCLLCVTACTEYKTTVRKRLISKLLKIRYCPRL